MSCVYVYVSINYYSILLCPLWKLSIMTLDFCVSVCIISKLLNSYGLPILTLSNLYLEHTIVCILFISSLCCAIISDLDYMQWRIQGGGGGVAPKTPGVPLSTNPGSATDMVFISLSFIWPLFQGSCQQSAAYSRMDLTNALSVLYLTFIWSLYDLYFRGDVSSRQLVHL